MVTIVKCSADELQATVQSAKDSGRRILALSPSKLKKTSARSNEFEAIEFVVVSQ